MRHLTPYRYAGAAGPPRRRSLPFLLLAGLLFSPFGAVPSPGLAWGAFHDFHTSLTQLVFEPKTQTIEISIRVFSDDLETALTQENAGKLVRLASPDKPNKLVEGYVRRHFVLADGQRKPRPYTYLGFEQEADAHWIYLEVPDAGAEPFKQLFIKQDLLMDIFGDQVNLVTLQYNQQKKTVVFRNNQRVQAVSL